MEGFLDTAAGPADRYVETNGPFSNVVDHLEDGLYVALAGYDGDYPSGVSLDVDGDRAHRRSVVYARNERDAREWWVADEEAVSSRRTPGANESERSSTDVLAPYETVDVERTGRRITFSGTLPTADLAPIDTTITFE